MCVYLRQDNVLINYVIDLYNILKYITKYKNKLIFRKFKLNQIK